MRDETRAAQAARNRAAWEAMTPAEIAEWRRRLMAGRARSMAYAPAARAAAAAQAVEMERIAMAMHEHVTYRGT